MRRRLAPQGKLAIHINDANPTIAARNFALLFLLLKARRGRRGHAACHIRLAGLRPAPAAAVLPCSPSALPCCLQEGEKAVDAVIQSWYSTAVTDAQQCNIMKCLLGALGMAAQPGRKLDPERSRVAGKAVRAGELRWHGRQGGPQAFGVRGPPATLRRSPPHPALADGGAGDVTAAALLSGQAGGPVQFDLPEDTRAVLRADMGPNVWCLLVRRMHAAAFPAHFMPCNPALPLHIPRAPGPLPADRHAGQ